MLSQHETLLPLANAIGGRATLIDMPGHGQSDNWDGTTPYQEQLTKIAASFCDSPTHVIGHSYGAAIALRLAVQYPELVSRLTLIEPVLFAAAKGRPEHNAYTKAFRPFVAAMLQGDEERAAEIFNSLWSRVEWSAIPKPMRDYLIKRIYLVVATYADLGEDPDGITSPETLAQLKTPVTLIRGAKTQSVIGGIHHTLVERLPDATDHVVEKAGHMLPIRNAFIPQVAGIIRAAETGTG